LVFVDEASSAGDCKKVINSIAWASNTVEAGLIYRYDPERAGQWRSFLVILLAVYTATIGGWFIGEKAHIDIDNMNMDAKTLLIVLAAVLTEVIYSYHIEKLSVVKQQGCRRFMPRVIG
jgi:hypothetical protein